ncbi:MAG: phenylalanine--tRNA ligase beta subunit-related protein [Atribacterota bacterium]|nr:phenylalanine--tRNA ligase beta subunit-related protein [Atribacterota bacterium]
MLIISEKIKKVYPESLLGILAIRKVCNPNQHEGLNQCKLELENNLRKNFAQLERSDLKNMEPLKPYNDYYKRFKKTYQVLLQLESIVFKNKSIPRVASLVEVMFMAELKNLLLTAGHDLEAIDRPLRLDVSSGKEKYTLLNGQEKELLPGDMMISDLKGIISSIIFGPDKRTRIQPNTRNVLFVVYAPPGIEKSKVFQHLQDIQNYVGIITAESEVELLKVFECKD